MFEEEAWKYNVYPLYDDMLKRLNAVNDVLFGDQKEYVYYAPGAVRIAEKASAPVKGRSHKIETTIDLKGGEEGVIVACGGMTGGYTMFIKGGRVYFDYNFLDGVFYNLESEPLPEGKVDIKFDFTGHQGLRRRGRTLHQRQEAGHGPDARDAPQHLLTGGDLRHRHRHRHPGFEALQGDQQVHGNAGQGGHHADAPTFC